MAPPWLGLRGLASAAADDAASVQLAPAPKSAFRHASITPLLGARNSRKQPDAS